MQSLPNVPDAAEKIAMAAWNGIVGMAISSEDGTLLAVNEHFAELLGYSPRQMVGMHFRQITAPADQADDEREFGLLVSGEISHYQIDKSWIGKRNQQIAGTLFVRRAKSGEIVFAIAQIVQSQSPEQIESMRILMQGMLDEVLSRQGYRIVEAEHDNTSRRPWHRSWQAWSVIFTAWPAISLLLWFLYKLIRLVDGD